MFSRNLNGYGASVGFGALAGSLSESGAEAPHSKGMHPGEIWFGKSFGARLARVALLPLSGLYWLGWQAYLGVYRFGLKRAREPHKPVIVVGNITTGGSGKTPVTLCLAHLLREMGHEVVISCSGYGSPHAEDCEHAPQGQLDPSLWGDEPTMIRWFLPDVELVVGRARVHAAEIIQKELSSAVMLMDDGFQHLPLKKHLSIVIEPDHPKNAYCLPAGPYREPRRNLKRADLVLSDSSRPFHLVRSPLRFETPKGEVAVFQKATALCAIGSPELFLEALREQVELVDPLVLPDHATLEDPGLLDRLPSGMPIVVTAKDWVKLRQRSDVASKLFIIALQEVTIEPQAEFKSWLKAKLDNL